tara:strand:+ start:1412 stop:2659 length:1248 start_codon:yes stop_codon:yes gene_type:complete
MRLLKLIEDFRAELPATELTLSYGSQWVGDKRKNTPLVYQNNRRQFWVDSSGNRTTNWQARKGQRTEYVRNCGINIRDTLQASNYLRGAAKVMRTEYEFKEVNDTHVLVKRTNTIWKLAPASGPRGRYERTTQPVAQVAMQGNPSVIEEQIFLLSVPAALMPSSYQDSLWSGSNQNNHTPYVGLTRDCTCNRQTTKGSKTTPAMFVANWKEGARTYKVIMKELRGTEARLWTKESVTQSDVNRILNPDTAVPFEIPNIKRKKIKWHEVSEDAITMGALVFSKIREDTSIVAGDNLGETFRNEGINLVCSIPDKCLLTYPKNGKYTSQEIDKGVYCISVEGQSSKSIYEGRKAVIEILHNYRIEYDFNRMDFLSVIDIDSGELTESEGSLGRIGSIEEFDDKITSGDTSLLDRLYE